MGWLSALEARAAVIILPPGKNIFSTSSTRRCFRNGGSDISQGYLLIYFQRFQDRFLGTVPFSDLYPRLGFTLGLNGMDAAIYKTLFGTDPGKTLAFDFQTQPRLYRGLGNEFSNIQISNAPIPMDGITQVQFKLLLSSTPIADKTPLETGLGEANAVLKMIPVASVQAALGTGMSFYNLLDPSLNALFGLNTQNNRIQENFGLNLAGPNDPDNLKSIIGNGSILVYDDRHFSNWNVGESILSLPQADDKWSFDGALKLGGRKVPADNDCSYWILRLEYVDSVVTNGDELVGAYGDYSSLIQYANGNPRKLSCFDAFEKIDAHDCLGGSPADLDDLKARLIAAEGYFTTVTQFIQSQKLLTQSDQDKLIAYYRGQFNETLDKSICPRDYDYFLQMVPQRYSVAEDIVSLPHIAPRIQATPTSFWAKLNAKLDSTPHPTSH